MKKNKNKFTPQLFFYLNSIFVFVIIALSAFFKVTTFVYDQDMAKLNKSGEGINILPLTGSFDESFGLGSLIAILAVVAAFLFILKLSRSDFRNLFLKPKSKKKVKSRSRSPIIFKITLIGVLVLLGLSLLLAFYKDQYASYLQQENLKAGSPIALEDSTRYPGTIEEVIIKATPRTENDTVALVRLSFDNATILDVQPLHELTLGTCTDGKLFTAHSICADVSQLEHFKPGDPLLKVRIQWGEEGGSNITADTGNGYYDGININTDEVYMAVDIGGVLPITGEEVPDNSVAVFVLLAMGLVFILVILIVFTKNHPAFRKIPVYYSMFLIIALGVSTIYIGNEISMREDLSKMEDVRASVGEPGDDWFKCPGLDANCVWTTDRESNFCASVYPIVTAASFFEDLEWECTDDEAYCRICEDCHYDLFLHCLSTTSTEAVCDELAATSKQKLCFLNKYIMGCARSGDRAVLLGICNSGENCENTDVVCGGVADTPVPTATATAAPTPTITDSSEVVGTLMNSSGVTETIDGRTEYVIFRVDIDHAWFETVCGSDQTLETCILGKNFSIRAKNGYIVAGSFTNAGGTQTSLPDTLFAGGTQTSVTFDPGGAYGTSYTFEIVVDKTINPNISTFEVDALVLLQSDTTTYQAKIIPTFVLAITDSSVNTDRCALIPDPRWANLAGDYCAEPVSKILLTCNADREEVNARECEGNCVVADAGQDDYCSEDSGGGGVYPTATNNPTVAPQDTSTPTDTTYPTQAPSSVVMQCGQKGCERDSDCATGLPEYECDESSVDWPNNNQCVKVCPDGETRIDECTCSGTGGLYQCGPIDVDGNGTLNFIDLAQFRKVYNKSCSDSPYQGGGCKGSDTNNDNKVNFVDFASFAGRYYPKALSCVL